MHKVSDSRTFSFLDTKAIVHGQSENFVVFEQRETYYPLASNARNDGVSVISMTYCTHKI